MAAMWIWFPPCAIPDANSSLLGYVGTSLVAASLHHRSVHDANSSVKRPFAAFIVVAYKRPFAAFIVVAYSVRRSVTVTTLLDCSVYTSRCASNKIQQIP